MSAPGNLPADRAGEVRLHLSWDQAKALASSIQSARRGRADLLDLARLGERSTQDVARMRCWHEREQAVEDEVVDQIVHQLEVRESADAPAAALP